MAYGEAGATSVVLQPVGDVQDVPEVVTFVGEAHAVLGDATLAADPSRPDGDPPSG
jgi:hypothetical protein